MRNIKLEIEYDGTDFAGWEVQPGKRTVRGEIEQRLKRLFQEEIKLKGASRTDAGVHAIRQVVNFKTDSLLPLSNIKRALLGLPHDIHVRDVCAVPVEFSARKDAKSRLYVYRLLLGRSALFHTRMWEYSMDLDIGRMEEVFPLFLGLHPFDQFSHKDTGECDVKSFSITKGLLSCWGEVLLTSEKLSAITFEIEANRFLHRMVRMIIGAITEVGRGRIGEEEIKASLELKGKKHFCAPACGLYLREVRY